MLTLKIHKIDKINLLFISTIALQTMIHAKISLGEVPANHYFHYHIIIYTKRIFLNPRLIKGTLANSVDPDQTPQNAASDQGRHCLHKVQEFL